MTATINAIHLKHNTHIIHLHKYTTYTITTRWPHHILLSHKYTYTLSPTTWVTCSCSPCIRWRNLSCLLFSTSPPISLSSPLATGFIFGLLAVQAGSGCGAKLRASFSRCLKNTHTKFEAYSFRDMCDLSQNFWFSAKWSLLGRHSVNLTSLGLRNWVWLPFYKHTLFIKHILASLQFTLISACA